MSVNQFCKFFLQDREATRAGAQDVLQVGDDEFQLFMLVLNLVDVQPAQLIESAFCDGLGLGFAEIKRCDSRHGLIPPKNGFELLTAGAGLTNSHHIINAVLGFHQAFEDVGTGLCFLEVKRSSSLDHRFSMSHIGVNHRREVQEDGTPVKDTHHVGRIRLLESARFEQLIQDSVRVSVVLDFNNNADALFRGLVADVPDADDDLLVDQISDLDQHIGLLDLIGDFVNHDTLAVLVIKHLALRTHVETALAGGVHVDDTVDAMDGCSSGEVRTLYVLHVFFYRDIWFAILSCFKNGIDVEVDRSSNFCQVVRWNSGGHTNCNSVAAVQQKIGKARWKHGGFVLRIIEIRLEIHGVLVDVIKHVLGNSVETAFRVSHGGRWVTID